MQFTIMNYNIERGFHSKDHLLEKERLLAAQKAIKEINPDILTLTEACYGSPNSQNILVQYQKLFNFPYYQFGSYQVFGPNKGDEGGNCLLSKFPINPIPVKLAYKGAIRTEIPLENIILTIDVIHPSYSVNDKEKIKTLKHLILTKNHPYILTGDFNTVHPEDEYDWDILKKELILFNQKNAKNTIINWQNPQLIPWLLKLNLKDAFPTNSRSSTVPTNYAYQKAQKGVRMDFFFISPPIKVINTYVLKNKYTEIASDHYPIIGLFEIK